MEAQEDELNKTTNNIDLNGTSYGLIAKQIENLLILQNNFTALDLSSKNIAELNVKLPPTLLQLNISNNKLTDVPDVVLKLENLKILNISNNKIKYFDDVPNFCHSLEQLDLSNNDLEGLPYWVWAETPHKLEKLNLGNNTHITRSFITGCFEELLTYPTIIVEIDLENCALSVNNTCYTEFLSTFPKAKALHIGSTPFTISKNNFIEMPFKGLDKCSDLERLNVCNTNIYTINSSIDIYKNIVEINLAHNNIAGLPKEFCNLENLEICVLSVNKILYLPEEMHNLKKLVRLYLDSNDLCMIPDNLHEISSLRTLDLYDNNLNEIPEMLGHLEEIDLACNYFEEPKDAEYISKKEQLRLVYDNRIDGRKMVKEIAEENEYSDESTEDDEELYEIIHHSNKKEDSPKPPPDPPSSPEDWDSDAYWVPSNEYVSYSHKTAWLHFVKRKMAEGNFCPMDAHVISVAEKIKYERMCNPVVEDEVEGQFDDYSSDET